MLEPGDILYVNEGGYKAFRLTERTTFYDPQTGLENRYEYKFVNGGRSFIMDSNDPELTQLMRDRKIEMILNETTNKIQY